MKIQKNYIWPFVLLVIVSALYKVIPYESRPAFLGAPQFAMAIFAGSVIKDTKWAFALPIFSLLLGDVLMEILFQFKITPYSGFYKGQFTTYVLFALMTVTGFFINRKKVMQILGGVFAAPTVFFLISNFLVWANGGGLHRPKTMAGLIECYGDAVPFYLTSLAGTAIFAVVFFGAYQLMAQKEQQNAIA